MKSRPTLRDISKATGYHFTTVGLALRGDPRILPETSKEIQEVAQRLGYVQDAMLSALSSYRHSKRGRFAGVIGFLHTYANIKKEHKTNHRSRMTFEAATARATEMGFKLEPIAVREPGLTGKRLTEILRARGIKCLILVPMLPVSGPYIDLEWEHFITVAIGYSVTSPDLHRTSFNQAQSTQLLLKKLRSLGYKRIALQLLQESNIRTRGNVLGAYLADQINLPPKDRIPPLLTKEVFPTELRAWLKKYKPDCIVASELALHARLLEMGYNIPEDFGLAVTSRDSEECKMAGIDEQSGLLGSSAVDFVVSLLQLNERGLPEYPRFMLVEGRWVWKPTVRAAPATVDVAP